MSTIRRLPVNVETDRGAQLTRTACRTHEAQRKGLIELGPVTAAIFVCLEAVTRCRSQYKSDGRAAVCRTCSCTRDSKRLGAATSNQLVCAEMHSAPDRRGSLFRVRCADPERMTWTRMHAHRLVRPYQAAKREMKLHHTDRVHANLLPGTGECTVKDSVFQETAQTMILQMAAMPTCASMDSICTHCILCLSATACSLYW